jgi:hypothetical protein
MKIILNTLTILFCLQLGVAQPNSYLAMTSYTSTKAAKSALTVFATDGVYDNEVQIFWAAKGRAYEYLVFRSESPNQHGKEIGKGWQKENNFSDREVSSHKNYYYSVKYRSADEESEFSKADLGFAKRVSNKMVSNNSLLELQLESIKEYCKDVPMQERIPIVVIPFHVMTKGAKDTLGIHLSKRLANVLSNISCFQVLENKEIFNNSRDEYGLRDEDNLQNAITESRLRGIPLLISAQITDVPPIKDPNTMVGAALRGSTVGLEFILKVTSPQSRKILFTETIFSRGEVLNDVIEKAIITTCYKLVRNKDEFSMKPQVLEYTTQIKVSNTSITKLEALKESLNGIVDSKISVNNILIKLKDTEGVLEGILTVRHKGTTDELLELLISKMGKQLEIIGMDKNIINVIIKD